MSPKVSILVTVYNREQYLAHCIESILHSRFSDFELLIVDDASRDASFDIARALQGRDRRIRIHQNSQNLGQCGNRNKAASIATGTYIKYVDSDDIIYPHSLQLMVDAIEQSPSIALALSHSQAEAEEPYPLLLTPHESMRKQFLGRGVLSCGPSSAIIRRAAFAQLGGFRDNYGVALDTDLWIQLAMRWKIALLPPGLVWWRRHVGQAFTANAAAMEYLTLGYKMCIDAINDKNCPLTSEERKIAILRQRQHLARKLLSIAIRQRRPIVALNTWRQTELSILSLLAGFRGYTQ